jgi:hypothetical protein
MNCVNVWRNLRIQLRKKGDELLLPLAWVEVYPIFKTIFLAK